MKKTKSVKKELIQKQKLLLFIFALTLGATTLYLFTQKPAFFAKNTNSIQETEESNEKPLSYSSDEMGISFEYDNRLQITDVASTASINTGTNTPLHNIPTPGVFIRIAGGEYSLPIYRYKDSSAQKVATQIHGYYQPRIALAKKYIQRFAQELREAQDLPNEEVVEKILSTVEMIDENVESGKYSTFQAKTFTDKNGRTFPAYEGTALTDYSEYYIDNFTEKTFVVIQDGSDVLVIEYWPGNMETASITLDSIQIQ